MINFSTSSFIAGVMLGALLTGAWFFASTASFMTVSPSLFNATSTMSLTQKSGALSVVDQISGDTVTVESVTVPPPGVWVAVHEVNGKDLGNILGATRVNGPRSAVFVSLLRATEPGRSYAIELYRDDNGGVFDPSLNSAYVDFDTGARVVAYFSTTN
ncbi:MAG: hypothetical protein V1711_02140 [bacterium]